MAKPEKPRIFVVDDQLAMAETIADSLVDLGYDAIALDSSVAASERLGTERVDLLVTDLRMPKVDGLELLGRSLALDAKRPVIVMTAYGAIDSAVEAIRRGAFHYLAKPFKNEELAIFVERALDRVALQTEAEALRKAMRPGIVAESRAMREALDIVHRVADADMPVLILGETGTGKGMLAELLHASSARAKQPFVPINCAAIPEALLESELFGHVKGAFTGATADRNGLLVDASGGTLFLDEIGDLALPLQAKLLHVLERGTVRPVGGSRERTIDVRIVAATHRDLREHVRAGTFREDLLYRLDVVSFEVPALRHRREDLPGLVDQMLARSLARHAHAKVKELSPEALRLLVEHPWPGNVRELAHTIERAVVLAKGTRIEPDDLPAMLRGKAAEVLSFAGPVVTLREVQRRYAAWVLEQQGGHRGRTAEVLGVDPKTLAKLLSETQ
ncbi:MAG: sigma-54-dependent transcriptional regulator [Polyangiales bacterium]